jgi:hypothetical protein
MVCKRVCVCVCVCVCVSECVRPGHAWPKGPRVCIVLVYCLLLNLHVWGYLCYFMFRKPAASAEPTYRYVLAALCVKVSTEASWPLGAASMEAQGSGAQKGDCCIGLDLSVGGWECHAHISLGAAQCRYLRLPSADEVGLGRRSQDPGGKAKEAAWPPPYWFVHPDK